jgi:hypothetical protein
MNYPIRVALACALLLPSGAPAIAKLPDEGRVLGVESSIAFPGDATIKTWSADGEDGIWIQSRQGDWYYGKFVGSCRNLDFAYGIGIDNRGTSELDRFGAIRVGGERCQLGSFVTSAPPPTKAEIKAARAAAKAQKDARKVDRAD